MKLIILIVVALFLLSLGKGGELTANITTNTKEIEIGKPIELTLTVKGTNELNINVHKALKDSIMISSVTNTCKEGDFYIGNRSSDLVTVNVSDMKHAVYNVTGYLSKDVVQGNWVLNFGELGIICASSSDEQIEFSVSFFEGEMDMFSFRDYGVYAGHIKLQIKQKQMDPEPI